MPSRKGVLGSGLLILFGLAAFAGVGCRTCGKVPCYYADPSVKDACLGKPARDHQIEVDDMGGVGVSDICVVVSREKNHSVRWVPKSQGKSVWIAFILQGKQPEPFQGMACGAPDRNGNRICVLSDCPDSCKTTFRDDYKPSTTDSSLNYYYYSPGVTMAAAGAAKAGSDPGIRIDP
jgi:hypothetical protein